MHIHGSQLFDGSCHGREQVIAAIAANFGKVTGQKPRLEAMVHQSDASAMLLHETGYLKADGLPYEVRGVIWYTFEHGKLKRVEEFLRGISAG